MEYVLELMTSTCTNTTNPTLYNSLTQSCIFVEGKTVSPTYIISNVSPFPYQLLQWNPAIGIASFLFAFVCFAVFIGTIVGHGFAHHGIFNNIDNLGIKISIHIVTALGLLLVNICTLLWVLIGIAGIVSSISIVIADKHYVDKFCFAFMQGNVPDPCQYQYWQ